MRTYAQYCPIVRAVEVVEIDLLDAVRAGEIQVSGDRRVVSRLPDWLQLSPVVPYVRAARTAAG